MIKTVNRLLFLLLLVGFIACDKEETISDISEVKQLKLSVDLKGLQTANLDNHILEIKDESDATIKSFSDLQNLPSSIELVGGSYTARVSSALTTPAFDQPLYGGSKSFTITDQQTTAISMSVSQANVGIKVVYADDFKAAYTNYSTVVSSADGSLSYSDSESRFGYFVNGPITVTLTYTDADNAVQTVVNKLEANNPSIAAGSALTIKFKASAGDVYTGYYADASGKTGLELKSTLGDIISNGFRDRSYDDLWDIYKKSDIRSDGTIWDMYSDNPNGPESYTFYPGSDQCGSYTREGSCYNREHSVPKSWFNKAQPMHDDMVHLVPTDGYVNGKRSNYPFGEVGSATWDSSNGCKVGSAKSGLGYSGTVFEPIDEYKGDFARIYFYFVTRYDDRIAGWDGDHENEVFSSNGYGLDRWTIDMFLRWSKNDPVSKKERDRNEHIEDFQNNRNPYVDHPEFIDRIWGQLKSSSALKSESAIQVTELTWSVN
ncbi:MAG: endonuclease [Carboxylicivirga sp.]|jgi:endonuclease I|nr:endonuclease [Carboxylicivirga sp.]